MLRAGRVRSTELPICSLDNDIDVRHSARVARFKHPLRFTLQRHGSAVIVAVAFGCCAAVSSCETGNRTLACKVSLGAAQNTIKFVANDGASSTASLAGYKVVFQIHANSPRMEAQVKDSSGATLLRAASGGFGNFTGSTATPDGQLSFACVG
jgi:hypothetical protein